MTKKHLADEIYKTVVLNEEIGMTRKEIIEMIIGLLTTLEPKNKQRLVEWNGSAIKGRNQLTKDQMAFDFYNTVKINNEVGVSKKEIIEIINKTLTLLEPKDKDRFSKWGQPEQRSTVNECWK